MHVKMKVMIDQGGATGHVQTRTRHTLGRVAATSHQHSNDGENYIDDDTPPPSPGNLSPGTLTPDSQASELARMAEATPTLTAGCLEQTTTSAEGTDLGQPIVQCLQVKQMGSVQNGVERWRVVMNDGINFMQGMLSTGE